MIKVKNILPESIYWPFKIFYDGKIKTFYVKSYSQEGEDLILARMLGEKTEGFYIDVGAHHPKRFSNTFLFYKRGWRGINIATATNSDLSFNLLMECKLYTTQAKKVFSARVMNKYDVEYFRCDNCESLFTENPYWLNEAFERAIKFWLFL